MFSVLQVRPRFVSDSDFDAVSEEAVRVRIFKDYIKTIKVWGRRNLG